MPPFIPTRLDQAKPHSSSEKESLFKAADTPNIPKKTLQDNKNFLEKLGGLNDESSLSDISSEEFEDALPQVRKRRKINKREEGKEEEEEEEIDWEDAIEIAITPSNGPSRDLDLTLDQDDDAIGAFTDPHNKKKGPSKIEREIRILTHRMHVQFLLFHNMSRSRWACDSEVQKILLDQLSEQIQIEVDKWRKDSGFSVIKMVPSAEKPISKGRKNKTRSHEEKNQRNQRDWGNPAERQENGEPNMSAGDPIIRLLKHLASYWRRKFTVTAPGLRKQGYRTLPRLEEYIASFRKEAHDLHKHGERIDGIEGFRKAARTSEGSRDIGAQLFTTLLRGLGIESRLVASLQPIGFGWSKNEDASIKGEKQFASPKRTDHSGPSPPFSLSSSSDSDGGKADTQNIPTISRSKPPRRAARRGRKPTGAKDVSIEVLDDGKAISVEQSDENESVVDVTPESPHKKRAMQYDQDLLAPNYWTEVVSPITFRIYPVDALVSKIPIITSPEYLSHFEPRGIRADKAKQVIAYVIAYSPDGTAKDVTTRYLKRHLWPGRTKGVRMPIEKIPLYNKNGKIKKYEEYDWFKSVMSGYERPHVKRTAVDELEEETDLKRAKIEKKEANVREDTLQFYKTSAEFVLERHLRREEAIKPASKPVRMFISGKGGDTKEEPVFRRQDIEVCRSGESWHKEGRAIKPGEHPLKMVSIRAVTLTRKREVEEAERDSGEKQKQGLYARNQTDWIIPLPIENGRIPKNAYGNIDCFVPTMIPKGAVHIPLRKTVMICKKLGIDYAEAVTGFEFGNKMAVPVIEGVVVAEQHENIVIDQWEKDETERKIKEAGKREKMALGTWRKWLMGLRIIQRVTEEYGGDRDAQTKEALNPFTNQSRTKRGQFAETSTHEEQTAPTTIVQNEEMGGGFVLDENQDDEGLEVFSNGNNEARQHSSQLIINDMDEETSAPPCGLAALAADDTSRQFDDEVNVLESGKDDEAGLDTSPDSPKPPHSMQDSSSEYHQKRKARSPSLESRRKAIRTVPKRDAARQSETALKSHYFAHESDSNSEIHRGNEDSESENTAGRSLRGKRIKPTRSSRNTGRARKNLR